MDVLREIDRYISRLMVVRLTLYQDIPLPSSKLPPIGECHPHGNSINSRCNRHTLKRGISYVISPDQYNPSQLIESTPEKYGKIHVNCAPKNGNPPQMKQHEGSSMQPSSNSNGHVEALRERIDTAPHAASFLINTWWRAGIPAIHTLRIIT